jgi:hypothetical protein
MSTLQTTILKHPDAAGSQVTFTSGGDINFDSGTVYIDSTANRLGIGTNTPTAKLTVEDSTATKANFTHASSNKTALYIESDDTSARIGSTYYGSGGSFKPLAFLTAGTERMSISSSGTSTFASTVQVGGNPFPGTATGFAAYIDGSIALSSASASGTIFFGYTTGSSTQTTTITGGGTATFAGSVISGSLAPGGGGGNYLSVGEVAAYSPAAGNHVWRGWNASSSPNVNTSQIFANGNSVFAGTVSAQGSVLTSDQRFKENITDANPQLVDVTALGNKLRNWDWTADAPVADKDTRFLGLVAQEAETICPGIVTTVARTKDGAELTPEVVVPAVYETKTVPAVLDDKGEVVKAETTEQVLVTAEQVTPATYEQLDDSYKGIKNDILIMKLLGAVAELSAKVAALEAG